MPPPALSASAASTRAIDGLARRAARRGRGGARGRAGGGRGRTRRRIFTGSGSGAYQAIARRCRARGVPYVVSPHGMLEPWAWGHKAWKKRPYYHLFEKRFLRARGLLLATAEPEAARLRALLPALPRGDAPARHDRRGRARLRRRARGARLAPGRARAALPFPHPPEKGPRSPAPGAGARESARPAAPGDRRGRRAGLRRESCAGGPPRHASALPRVDWIGPVWGEARWPYFQGADLFCLPTHSENFGLVVLEAWQTGTPVLTTPGTPWAAELAGPRLPLRPGRRRHRRRSQAVPHGPDCHSAVAPNVAPVGQSKTTPGPGSVRPTRRSTKSSSGKLARPGRAAPPCQRMQRIKTDAAGKAAAASPQPANRSESKQMQNPPETSPCSE